VATVFFDISHAVDAKRSEPANESPKAAEDWPHSMTLREFGVPRVSVRLWSAASPLPLSTACGGRISKVRGRALALGFS